MSGPGSKCHAEQCASSFKDDNAGRKLPDGEGGRVVVFAGIERIAVLVLVRGGRHRGARIVGIDACPGKACSVRPVAVETGALTAGQAA